MNAQARPPFADRDGVSPRTRSPSEEMIEASAPKPLKLTRFRAGVAIAVVVAVAVVVWFAVSGGKSSSKPGASRPVPVAATIGELGNVAAQLGHPLYWAGQKPGFTYELTQAKVSGNVWVRYLPAGVLVGDTRANFLTVGTYPKANAVQSVIAASKRKGAESFRAPGGGLAVEYTARPSSVYVAFPGSNLLVEVFDPSPAAARAVVKSGQIRPLG
jgi:hypothetical protein